MGGGLFPSNAIFSSHSLRDVRTKLVSQVGDHTAFLIRKVALTEGCFPDTVYVDILVDIGGLQQGLEDRLQRTQLSPRWLLLSNVGFYPNVEIESISMPSHKNNATMSTPDPVIILPSVSSDKSLASSNSSNNFSLASNTEKLS